MQQFCLESIRKRANKSQKIVADEAGISRQYYNYIERGVRLPPVKTAKKIAQVLDFDWTLFFEESDNAS